MGVQISESFQDYMSDPGYAQLTNPQKNALKDWWVNEMRMRSPNPYDTKLHQRLINEAYADVNPQEEQSNFMFGGSFFPSASEYPERMAKMVERIGRLWSIPQQAVMSLIKRRGIDPADFLNVGKEGLKDVIGAEEGKQLYPYHLYTDPLLVSGAVKTGVSLAPKVARTVGAVTKRIRPPKLTPKETEGFVPRRPLQPGEAVGRAEPLAGEAPIPGEIPPLETVRTPGIERFPYGTGNLPPSMHNKIMAEMQLGGQFTREEAQAISNFAIRHVGDPLANAIVKGQPLTPALKTLIQKRVLSRGEQIYTGMPTFGQAEKRVHPFIRPKQPPKPRMKKQPAAQPPPEVTPTIDVSTPEGYDNMIRALTSGE